MAQESKVVRLKQSPNKHLKITEKTLKGIRKRQQPWFIKDTQLTGFQIKVNPSGKHVYRVEARMGGSGRVKNYTIGSTQQYSVAEARNEARKYLQQIRESKDPREEKQKALAAGMTLQELLDEFLEHRDLKPNTKKEYRYQIERQFKKWLHRSVKELSSTAVKEWYLGGKSTPQQTDGAFRSLNSVLNYGVALEVIDDNPCAKVTALKLRYKPKQRNSYIDLNTELMPFLDTLVDLYRSKKGVRRSQYIAMDLIVLLLTTGLRASEAQSIKWSAVNWEDKLITIKDTKNRRIHIIPMTNLIYSMLQKRSSESGDTSSFVFPNRDGTGPITDIRKTMKIITDNAELEPKTLHDLRRTFASILNEIDVGLADTKCLLNHARDDITLQYIQNNREKLRGHLIEVLKYCDLHVNAFDHPDLEPTTYGTLRLFMYGKGDLTTFVRAPNQPPEEHLKHEYWEE